MPAVIDYPIVQQKLRDRGFVSLYHNSGAFGFAVAEEVRNIGWIGEDDPTIREVARAFVRSVPLPFEGNLARALVKARSALAGEAWLMPKSHWHYELHFGNTALLESLLKTLGIDPGLLRDRNDGSAIAFSADESDLLGDAAERLLGGLAGSDFLLVFPEAQTLCTIHHHKQLWWQTTGSDVAAAIDAVPLEMNERQDAKGPRSEQEKRENQN